MAAATQSLSLLTYDIPERAGFPNPSGALRRRALRVNLSCWVVAQGREPWTLLERMAEAGVNWNLWEFAPSASEGILKVAAANMRRELEENARREARALERIDAARDEAEANPANGPRTLDAARNRHTRERAEVLKRSERLARDLEEAARAFGLDAATLPFAATRTRCEAIRALNGARANLYAAMTEVVAPEQPELAAAARADTLPVGVLADAAEEAGHDVRAARAAFDGEAAAEGPSRIHSSMLEADAPRPRNDARNDERPHTVHYAVRTRTGARRSVYSDLTDAAAAELLAYGDDRFGRDLASRVFRGRRLSRLQRSWLHVLAMEVREAQAPAAAPQLTNDQLDRARVETPPVAADPHVVPEYSSRAFAFDRTLKLFSQEASQLGLATVPPAIRVRSAKTGAVVEFTLQGVEQDGEGETLFHQYAGPDGMRLRVDND